MLSSTMFVGRAHYRYHHIYYAGAQDDDGNGKATEGRQVGSRQARQLAVSRNRNLKKE